MAEAFILTLPNTIGEITYKTGLLDLQQQIKNYAEDNLRNSIWVKTFEQEIVKFSM